jgi:glycosidase
MKRDGEYFWLEIDGLVPNQEYAFQYVVDESIYIADPYCDKILHPLDQYISDEIYPNLREFPSQAINSIGYYNTVSVLQTGQEEFVWTDGEYQKPPKEKLVVYELLVRDFFNNGQETYKNLTDTLSYIKSLGVNAIELMPITEYSGNDSWGYNPTFMFAVDKAHGTKNDLKEFINTAHEMGIAVILDIVLNQQEQPSPLILLDFNLGTGKVTEENLYFNVNATHDFSVFYDMDHLSPYTESFVDTVNHYWINEYHFDGYRFDLSKGFMQTGSFYDYNQERIDILKRMADALWAHSPDAYIILEHLGANNEEIVLSNYGMMLWGNIHGPYKENILGTSFPDIRWTHHGARGWNDMHVIGFMESHDEERQMYEALNFGGSSGIYNVRTVNNALERMKLASAFLYSIPGPKMLWQFGELGYDLSINRCGNGTISNDCRTNAKPHPWDNTEGFPYYLSENRTKLRKTVSELIKLKLDHDVFTTGNYSIIESTLSPIKQITLRNSSNATAPSSTAEMSVVVVGNFGLSATQASISFPFAGSTWYSYFDQGKSLTFSGSTTTVTLQPGEFRLYTNYALPNPEPELMENLTPLAPTNLLVSENQDGVSLSWTNNSTINDGNNVYRRVAGGDWVNISNKGRATTTHLDANVQEGVTYEYRIGTYTNVGETFSNVVEIMVEEFVLGLSDELAASIYPNPTRDKLTLKMADHEPLYYFVYDLNGRQAVRGKFTGVDAVIDLSAQQKGMYLLEVIMRDGERHFSKVFKH